MSDRRLAFLPALAVLLVGLAATAAAALGFSRGEESDRVRRFDATAELARGAVRERLRVHLDDLEQLRNLMILQPDISRDEFDQYVTLGLRAGLYEGSQALSFAPRVGKDDLASFEATVQAEIARADHYPPFRVHPSTNDELDSYVVAYIVPLVGNEEAFGFDLGSDPARRQAIEAARDRGGSVGSGPIRLLQETEDQVGFVVWSPVYDTGDIPETAPARRRHFLGVVSMVFRVGDMFAGALTGHPEVEVELYDIGGTVDTPEPTFDDSTRLLDTTTEHDVGPGGEVEGLHRDLDLNVADRRWRLVLTPGVTFDDGSSALPAVVAVLGGAASLALAGIGYVLGRARSRAETLAASMTVDLRAAEERARAILAEAPEAVLVADSDGMITRVNRATETLFDYSADELLGQPVEMLIAEDRRDIHRSHRAGYAHAPRRRDMGAELEVEGRRRDGSTVPLGVSLSPLVAGESREVIASLRDISLEHQAQAALLTAYDHEREAAEQLRVAGEMQRRFLGTISHELRTPLVSIKGFTGLMLGGAISPEQRDDFLQRVHRNADSLAALIADIIAFANFGRDDSILELTRSDLAEQARLVVDQLSQVTADHIVVVDAPDPVHADIESVAFTRILTNLLTNATRYSPSGTVITVSVGHEGHRALLSVTDQGPGIPLHERERVFEPFFRGAAAVSSGEAGTGIGLAVASDLARRLGGSMRVSPAPGSGACFELDLPVSVEAKPLRR